MGSAPELAVNIQTPFSWHLPGAEYLWLEEGPRNHNNQLSREQAEPLAED